VKTAEAMPVAEPPAPVAPNPEPVTVVSALPSPSEETP